MPLDCFTQARALGGLVCKFSARRLAVFKRIALRPPDLAIGILRLLVSYPRQWAIFSTTTLRLPDLAIGVLWLVDGYQQA